MGDLRTQLMVTEPSGTLQRRQGRAMKTGKKKAKRGCGESGIRFQKARVLLREEHLGV